MFSTIPDPIPLFNLVPGTDFIFASDIKQNSFDNTVQIWRFFGFEGKIASVKRVPKGFTASDQLREASPAEYVDTALPVFPR